MKLSFSPVRMDADFTLAVAGDVLTLNGEAFDFTPLQEGDTLPRDVISSDWFAGDVSRTEGRVHLTLILPHGGNPPPWMLFPEPILDPEDGVLFELKSGLPAVAVDDQEISK